MKNAPTVPGDLEQALFQLAAQFPLKTHLNIHCEKLQLKIHVLVQNRQVTS
jgi:hypothetical protein